MSNFKKHYEEGLKMQAGAGQRMVADWVLPNDDELFDDEAKAKEFAEDAGAYVDLISEAHSRIETKKH